jgi:hypothetical protein
MRKSREQEEEVVMAHAYKGRRRERKLHAGICVDRPQLADDGGGGDDDEGGAERAC